MADDHESRAIDILVDGFQDNPVPAWVFGDPTARAAGIRAYMEFFVSAYGDHGVLEIEEGGEGAALWAEPDGSRLDADQTAALVGLIQKFSGDRTGLVLGTLGALQQPSARHWYLNVIAARRGARGRGIAP